VSTTSAQRQPPPFNWLGFLAFAQANASSPSETIQRTAASRAYYAVFNICRDWLEERGYAIQPTQAHKQVWDAFKQAAQADDATAPDWRLVGQHGTTLRTLRNQADYDDRVKQLARRLQAALVTAELALNTLPALQTK
jgi:hypothetical protein